MSRPAPPNRTEKEWPRFPRKGEPGPDEPTGHSKNYLLFRRILAASCGLCFLGGAALYACGTVRPALFLDQDDTLKIIVVGVIAMLLWGISNYDIEYERVGPLRGRIYFTFMTHLPRPVRVATVVLLLGLGALHAFEIYAMKGQFIRIRAGDYALFQSEGRHIVTFLRWPTQEEFLHINSMQLRRIGSAAMFVFLLPTINFWFLREKLD